MDILTEKRQKITFSTTLKRLGGDWGLLLGDEMLQRSFNMKPLNETELEKVAKPDTRYKREEAPQAPKVFHIIC